MYVSNASSIPAFATIERRAPHGSGIVWSVLFAGIGWTVALMMI